MEMCVHYRDVYIFRLYIVCTLFITVFGLSAYLWSAMCIIFLLIDLIWTIRSPFNTDKTKQIRMSRIACVLTFLAG